MQNVKTLGDYKIYINVNNKLGEGAFGKVYKGKAFQGKFKDIEVAVKIINLEKLTQEDLISLDNETKLLRDLNSKNITKIYEAIVRKFHHFRKVKKIITSSWNIVMEETYQK
jgi:serine/threonine protein kinase